jgi:hypothetical protein
VAFSDHGYLRKLPKLKKYFDASGEFYAVFESSPIRLVCEHTKIAPPCQSNGDNHFFWLLYPLRFIFSLQTLHMDLLYPIPAIVWFAQDLKSGGMVPVKGI